MTTMTTRTILRQVFLRSLATAFTRRQVLRRRPPDKPENILLIRPDHLGDVLFTTPALRVLRQALPDARITYLVGPWARAVVEHDSAVDEVITCEFPGFQRRPQRWPGEPYRTLLRVRDQLAPYNFDTSVNLRFDFYWGALLAQVCGIPRRIGYDIASCRPFLTDRVAYAPGRHEVEQNLTLISGIIDTPSNLCSPRLEYDPGEPARAAALDFVREHGIGPNDPLVAIHPGSGAYIKSWTAQGWAQVADSLHFRDGAAILFTGSKAEEGLVEEIVGLMKAKAISAAGATSLPQLAALFEHCRLVLGVDSGPLHLAVAMGTPTVLLFGPSDDRAFGPWGDSEWHKVVRAACDCAPCGKLDFTPQEAVGHDCMRAISVDDVLAAAAPLLARSRTEV